MNTSRRAAVVALLFVYLVVRLFWWFDEQQTNATLRLLEAIGLFKVALWVFPAVAAVVLLRRVALPGALMSLGLDPGILRGLRFGFLATLPLAFASAFAPPVRLDPFVLVGAALVGPFAEEVLFRGFLQKQLLTQARWPVAWAIGVSAVAFGAAHGADLDWKIVGSLVQLTTGKAALAQQRLMSMGIGVLMMSAGGVVFGWIFYRLGSLWPAIAFHGFLNLWLTLSDSGGGPPVGAIGVGQVLSFALAVLLTLRRRPEVVTSASPVRLS